MSSFQISFRDLGGRITIINVTSETTVSHMSQLYCEKEHHQMDKILFFFRGQLLCAYPERTMKELEIRNESRIHVIQTINKENSIEKYLQKLSA